MPAFSTNEWIVMFLVLVVGWLLGLLSRSGGKKWRRAYEHERDQRLAVEKAHATDLATRDERITELERRPAPAASFAPAAGMAATSVAGTRAAKDDLSLIRGIGPAGETRLNEVGVHRYRDLRDLGAADAVALEDRLGAPRGTIDEEGWREQAALLEDGRSDEHRRRYV
jgi:predicted flap endonuclease-1-like 5' DNA nuclease